MPVKLSKTQNEHKGLNCTYARPDGFLFWFYNTFCFFRKSIFYCKSCNLNSSIPGFRLDDDGLCDYCSERKTDPWELLYEVTEERKKKLKAELDHMFEGVKGKHLYDCVLALSGGKDSSFLLYHLAKERGLKVLAVHIRTLFEPLICEKNIAALHKKLDFDLLTVSASDDYLIKFYSGLLQCPNKMGFHDTVCSCCGRLTSGYSIKVAIEKKVPFVVIGYSPGQNCFFEKKREKILAIMKKDSWFPDSLQKDAHGKEFKDYFWDPLMYSEETSYPRVIFPLHVMEYNAETVFRKLSQNKILPEKQLLSFRTNCDLAMVMFYLDCKFASHGKSLFCESYQIRKGMIGNRKVSTIGRLSRKARIIARFFYGQMLMKRVEKRLGINFRDICSRLCSIKFFG